MKTIANTKGTLPDEMLRDSEARYRWLFESTAIEGIFILDVETGQIVDVNPFLTKLLGFSREEIINKKIWELGLFKDILASQAHFQELLQKGFVRYDDLPLETADGLKIDVEFVGHVYEAGNQKMIQCSLRDITERKRREEKLRETTTFLEKLITNANVPIVVWDSQFRIIRFNHAFESLTGRTAGDVLRQTLDALFPSDRKQFTLENIQDKLISEQLRSVEVEIQPVKGPIRTLLWNAAPIFEQDDKTLLAVIAQGIDITEQRQAKEAMRVELQEKEVLLREIHHRVKNNMQVISSLFHLQAKNTMSDACRAILKEAQTRIQAMSLVHEKLYKSGHLSRIDFGEYINSLAIHLFQVYGVKPDLIRLETEFEDVNLDIASALPCGLLLNELISNALKHAFPGNRAGVVRIALKRGTGDLINVLVADDGIGFPEDLDFSKAESFGLQIVNLLVGQLDGRIELDRTKGAAFTVTFCELKYPPPV